MRERLTYANVLATLAVFGVVAGGTAVALPDGQAKRGTEMRRLHLRNGWASYSPQLAKPAAGKDSDGFVHLQGGITGNVAMSPFRLAPKLRPPGEVDFVIVTNGPGTAALAISKGGAAHISNINGDPSETSWLDGVTFRAG